MANPFMEESAEEVMRRDKVHVWARFLSEQVRRRAGLHGRCVGLPVLPCRFRLRKDTMTEWRCSANDNCSSPPLELQCYMKVQLFLALVVNT